MADPDIAQRLERLEQVLRECGQPGWADRLSDGVAGGATGTESLFRVGAVLADLRRSGVARAIGCEPEVKSLAASIDRTVKRGL